MSPPTGDEARAAVVPEDRTRPLVSFGAALDENSSESTDITPSVKLEKDDEKTSMVTEPRQPCNNGGGIERPANRKNTVDMIRASGPSRIFNPTSVRIDVRRPQNNNEDANEPPAGASSRADLAVLWRSRDNRKGRGSVSVPNSAYPIPHNAPPMTLNVKNLLLGILRVITTFPYWDMAFWSGWSYSIGSALFVIDGAFAFGPIAFPSTAFSGEAEYAVPLLFFIGTLFYEVGATMAYLEAVNDGSFAGSALRRFLDGHEDEKKEMLDEHLHDFFHRMIPHQRHGEALDDSQAAVDPEAGWQTRDTPARPGSIYPDSMHPAPRRGGLDYGPTEEGEATEYLTWRWWPTWHRLRTHHIYEIGYLACTIQLFGATLFGIAGIVLLPGILTNLSQWQQNAAYWIPQIVASVCFLSAGLLFTVETQEKWWKPKYRDLGWWIGFWAILGSVGFL